MINNELFDFSKELIEKIETIFSKSISFSVNDIENILVLFFIKSFNHFKSICILCENNLIPESSIILRTLIEMKIKYLYLSQDKEAVKRFYDYAKINKYKIYNKLKKYSEDVNLINLVQKSMVDLEKEYPNLRKYFNKIKSGKNPKTYEYYAYDMLKKIPKGNNIEYDYYMMFKNFCSIVHTDTDAELYYIKVDEEGYVNFNLSTFDDYLEINLGLAFKYFYFFLNEFKNILNNKKFNTWLNEWNNKFNNFQNQKFMTIYKSVFNNNE